MVLDRLPRQGSAFGEAVAQDDEVAQRVVTARVEAEEEGRAEPPPRWSPDVREWSLLHELLATTIDRLGEVGTMIKNQRRKTPVRPPNRYPRPTTAMDRAEQVRAEAHAASLEADYEAASARYQAARAAQGGPLPGGGPPSSEP